ncbi:MAG: hypothetical protein AB7O44_32770 [Hyphomicrobiaceae bacterium]
MRILKVAGAVLMAAMLATAATAQQGPVATACKADIGKLCAGKPHDGSVRICLEQKYAKVSAACKTALDTTAAGAALSARAR